MKAPPVPTLPGRGYLLYLELLLLLLLLPFWLFFPSRAFFRKVSEGALPRCLSAQAFSDGGTLCNSGFRPLWGRWRVH